ncbi:DNA cross-link repair protein pso2/snm1 [Hypsizygus marmoreus]|uniref:DNA cross-link repair protein pso2/snm1 n=1 Tax=Hypsizygus marmoreus TaxID=39966 RepID=A0A369JX40_HYPMA|nr:DNA cross-link repair protein pso2/snm1 [Hypsizygus marmoreus]
MSSSKRKQVSKSTVTLHNFFQSGGESSRNRNGNGTTGRIQESKKAPPKVAPENIIVIDSDSEPEVVQVVSRKKQRRLSESSGEVEFIDGGNTKPLTAGGSVINTSQMVNATNDLQRRSTAMNVQDSPSVSSSSGSISRVKKIEKPTYSFGAPTLLLDTVPLATNSDSSSKPHSFGKPTLLIGGDALKLSASTCFNPEGAQQPWTDVEETQTELEFSDLAGEDWGTGDDETFLASVVEDEEEDVEEMIVDPSSLCNDEVTTTTIICPSCSKSLSGLSQFELSTHVNDCLDFATGDKRGPSSSRTTLDPASNSKPYRPLSSIPTPKVNGPMQLISCDGKRGNNAFSIMMSSHKENEAWKEASIVEDRNFRPTKSNGGRRKAPFYKVLQGMPIAVDAFRYGTIPGVNAYFLTHAHSDHYTNLAANWQSGPIYCSEATANLIIHMLSVDPKWVHPLPMDAPTVIPNTGGVRVTLIEANHCPGSCLFFFDGPQTVNAGDSAFKSPFVGSTKAFKYLHCGDFRASPQHVLHPAIKGKRIDHVYLDTTYLDPKYMFPPQPLVISACAELARRLVSGQSVNEQNAMNTWVNGNSTGKKTKPENILVVVGTYSIGKERIVKAIAQALQTKVYCDARKADILRCQADAELNALLCSNPLEANVHLVPLGLISSDKLKPYAERFKGKFSKVVGFRPTGWTYTQPAGSEQMPSIPSIISRQHKGFTYASLQPARNSTSTLQLFPVPYSEHSSFFELTCFAMSFDWGKMIATVNVGSETSRGKMAKWVARWEAERKKRGKDVIIPHRHFEYW